jgi:hypothetical protein
MNHWKKKKFILKYKVNGCGIDGFGVDHRKFHLRDEIAYQIARSNREQQLIQDDIRGIIQDYPTLGIDFWGLSPDNNYGFGFSNIENNINAVVSKLDKPLLKVSPDYLLYGDDFSKEFIDEMLNDKEYQRALKEYAIPNEGGYINDIKDPGGETNMGVSKRYHPNEDIKNLTRERANALLYKEIWNWNGINQLPPEIKGFVFDYGIRTSPQNAIETTHRALGINPVGNIIGNTTLGLLQNTKYEDFLHKYQELVKEQDKNRSGYQYFGTGWDKRTNGYHVTY